MAGKSRVPMQVSPEFESRIKKIQKNIMIKQGKLISLRDLTERVVKVQGFEELEKQILNIGFNDIRINLDRRRK